MAVSNDKLIDTTGIRLKDAFVVMVKTEWNAHVTDILQEGAIQVLEENGVKHNTLCVPGAIEIPFAIKHYFENCGTKRPDAFIALGCVIKGDTPHFDYVCTGVMQGVIRLNLTLQVPVIFGVLTVFDQMQADERTGGRHGHKGKEAAAAAIKMISLSASIKKDIS